jgi:HK97 family phage portal protein
MIFPAIRDVLRDIKQGFGSDPIRLDIERKGVGFDPTNIESYARNGYTDLYRILGGGGPSWSGETVSEVTATNLSTFWACRRIISEAGAFIPLEMMQKTRAGKFPANGVDVPEHPLYEAVKHQPNEEMSSMVFREAEIGNLLMSGNGFAQIVRRSGTDIAIGLEPLTPGQVRMDRDKEKRRVFIVNPGDPGAKTYTVEPNKPHAILHIIGPSVTGREGQGILQQARQSIGAAISADRYASTYYARGGRQPGFIKLDKTFKTKAEEDAWVSDLNESMDGPDGYHKWPIFQPGIDFKAWGWSPQDSQFIQAREYNVPEICRWFLLSPDLVGDMSKATLNNMEQLALRFVKMTLTAWLTRIEQDMRRCLLTPKEKAAGYYFKHNVNGLLRGDFLTRMQGYSIALQNGFKNIDGVRDLEDENALLDGAGRAYHIQMNMATVPGTGTPMIAEQGILNRTAAKPQAAA